MANEFVREEDGVWKWCVEESSGGRKKRGFACANLPSSKLKHCPRYAKYAVKETKEQMRRRRKKRTNLQIAKRVIKTWPCCCLSPSLRSARTDPPTGYYETIICKLGNH